MIFDTLIESLKNYREKYYSQFEIDYQNIIDEIDIRINNLIIEYPELMELNKLINEKTPLKITTAFDPETNKLTFQVGDKSIEMKFNRKDENVPIALIGQADLNAFKT